MSDTHSVYVAFDLAGNALYVGRTSRGERRLRQHGKAAEWWARVADIRVDHYSTREEAALREYEGIRFYRPEFNIETPSVLPIPPGWTDEQVAAFRNRNPLVRFAT